MTKHVYIYRSRARAVDALKKLADTEECVGATTCIPADLLDELWGIFGDGRQIIASLQREVFVEEALKRHPLLLQTLGTVQCIGSFISYSSGSVGYRNLLENDMDSEVRWKTDVAGICKEYERAIELQGFIEAGQAAYLLAKHIDTIQKSYSVHVRDVCDTCLALGKLLESLSFETHADDHVPVEISSNDVAVSCVNISGEAALNRAIHKTLLELQRKGIESMLVCCSDPYSEFRALAPYMDENGMRCILHTSKKFSQTSLGRSLLCVSQVIDATIMCKTAATDFAYNAWSGLKPREAANIDSLLRGNRAMSSDEIIGLLKEVSPTFNLLENLIENKDAVSESLDGLLEFSMGSNRLRDNSEEQKAIAFLVQSQSLLKDINRSISEFLPFLSDRTIQMSVCSKTRDGSALDITFCTLNSAGNEPDASFDAVIACDLDEGTLGASPQNALTLFAQEYDCAEKLTEGDRVRISFNGMIRAAKKEIVLIVSERDEAGQTAFPSSVLLDYLSELKHFPVSIENFSAVVEGMDRGEETIGEDDLASCVGLRFSAPPHFDRLQNVQRGVLEYLNLADYMRRVEGRTFVMSPSAVEHYLNCPYSWFVSNRMKLESLDEEFGPLEKGNFVHAVLKRFYDELAGGMRVDSDTRSSDALMEKVFDDMLEEGISAGYPRLVPITPIEHLEVQRMKRDLILFLHRLNKLPKSYSVHGHEIAIGSDDGADYAGVRINGRIDRVDIDSESGYFAVIDYKSNVSGHDAGQSDSEEEGAIVVPKKIQALIYAGVLAKIGLGTPSAALYMSYKTKNDRRFIAGSVNTLQYDVSGLVGSKSIVCDMPLFLGKVEEGVHGHLEELYLGNISENPRFDDACRYCPYRLCEERKC